MGLIILLIGLMLLFNGWVFTGLLLMVVGMFYQPRRYRY